MQGSARRTAEGRALLVADLVDHVHHRGHYAVERASRPTILIYALIGAALALLVSGLTLDFGETPISMSVVGVVVILLAVLCLSF